MEIWRKKGKLRLSATELAMPRAKVGEFCVPTKGVYFGSGEVGCFCWKLAEIFFVSMYKYKTSSRFLIVTICYKYILPIYCISPMDVRLEVSRRNINPLLVPRMSENPFSSALGV